MFIKIDNKNGVEWVMSDLNDRLQKHKYNVEQGIMMSIIYIFFLLNPFIFLIRDKFFK